MTYAGQAADAPWRAAADARIEQYRKGDLAVTVIDAAGHPVKENIDIRKGPKPPGTHFVGASMPFFLEFSPGYGLHQGYLPGFPASHGCVRMPYGKARQFYEAARIGTPVTVKP